MPRKNDLPPANDLPPDQTEAVGMEEGVMGNDAHGLYFTKAPRIDAWHAFTQEHEPVGMIVPSTEVGNRWHVRLGRVLVETPFTSATAARAYLMGWHDRDVAATRGNLEAVGRENTRALSGSPGINNPAGAPGTGRDPNKPEGGFDASAATTVGS